VRYRQAESLARVLDEPDDPSGLRQYCGLGLSAEARLIPQIALDRKLTMQKNRPAMEV
jgi:hypothetical protein